MLEGRQANGKDDLDRAKCAMKHRIEELTLQRDRHPE